MALPYNAFLLVLGFLFTLVLSYLWTVLWSRRLYATIPRVHCSSFIWGEEWKMYTSAPGSLYSQWHGLLGRSVAFTGAFGHQILSLTDLTAINYILGEGAYLFPKPSGVRAWFAATLGEGILWVSDRKDHEHQRRLLAPSFSQAAVKSMSQTFLETSLLLVDQWSTIIDAHKGNPATIDGADWAARFALDTIGRAAFGYDFTCLSGLHTSDLAIALDELTNNEHRRSSFYMRALFWLFPSMLHLGKKGKLIRRVKRELGDIAERMLKEAKMLSLGGKHDQSTVPQTILGHLLSSPGSRVLADDDIISQMRTIVSAAYEPVSATISWVFYELATNPSIQSQLRKEITAAAHSGDPASLDHPTLVSLPLLDAVIKECLRLHPPIIENHHEAAATVPIPRSPPINSVSSSRSRGSIHSTALHPPEISCEPIKIPRGGLIVIPVNVLHISKEIWGEDAETFNPSRWLSQDSQEPTSNNSNSNTIKQHVQAQASSLLAFSAGPRSCLGRSFAMSEVKTLLAIVLHRFSFTLSRRSGDEDGTDIEIETFQSFVIRPRVVGETRTSLPLTIHRLE